MFIPFLLQLANIIPIALETGRYKRIRDPVTKTFRSLRVEERLICVTFLKQKTKFTLYLYVPYITILEQRFFKL